MLHELIFALHGFPGAICTQQPVGDFAQDVGLRLLSDRLPFVTASEISLISQLLDIGGKYARLMRFIDRFCLTSSGSLYLTALAYAIDECLEEYREVLRSTEKDLLSTPHGGIVHIFSRIKPFDSTMAVLFSIIEPCIHEHDKNKNLLDIVSCQANRSSVFHIQRYLMRVFCQQLSGWLLEGTLYDPYDEFFIKMDLSLAPERFPTFLSPLLINDILYAGKAVRASGVKLSEQLHPLFGERFVHLDELDDHAAESLEHLVFEVAKFVSNEVARTLFEDHALLERLTLARGVILLGRGELFSAFLDNLVSAGLYGRSTGRDLLDRPVPSGLSEARALSHAVNLAFSAGARAVGMDDEKLSQSFRFSVSTNPRNAISETSDVGDNANFTAWNCLGLFFFSNLPSELEGVFTASARESYQRLFILLLTVRRTQHALNLFWVSDAAQRRARKDYLGSNEDALLRHQMAFFVDNLNCYLQMDVVETAFRRLLEAFKTTKELHQQQQQPGLQTRRCQMGFVEAIHETYLAGLEAQSLLLHPTITSLVLRLLNTCRRACFHPDQVGRTRARFDHLSSTLFSALLAAQSTSSLGVGVGLFERTGGGGGHLSKLLLRLDFNGFFRGGRQSAA